MTRIGGVRLFCQPGCARCARVQRWLAGLGADVAVTDVTADAAAQAELARRGLLSLPVVMTAGGNAVQGAAPARLAAALRLLSPPGPADLRPLERWRLALARTRPGSPRSARKTRLSRRTGGNSHV